MKFVKLAIALVVSCTISSGAANAQTVVIGSAVPANQQVSIDQIDHSSWNQLLGQFVNDQGQVNYRAWKGSQSATQSLDAYLASLSRANAQFGAGQASKFAFWINAYNALTIKGILREYPTSSIRNHTSETGGYNIWKTLYLPVGNERYNLDSIEHQVLRKMGDPRIHFAIVCASHSCPKLHKRAYFPQHIDTQLTYNTQKFFADPENFRWDPAQRTFFMSSIVKWFGSDFGATQADQLRYLSNFLPDAQSRAAAQQNAGNISYLNYSWNLNEQVGSLSQGSGTAQGSVTTQGIPTQGSGTVRTGFIPQATAQQGSGTIQRGFAPQSTVIQQGSGTVMPQGTIMPQGTVIQQGSGTVQRGFVPQSPVIQQGSGTIGNITPLSPVIQQGSGLR